jgi:predicted esterase
MKRLFTLMLFLSSTLISLAQTTGSFDTTIQFMSANRTLSFYVPTNYNPGTPAKLMICLHGLGDNSANYRNYLINSLSWNLHFPNTIFICPAASATNADFYYPAGHEAIIPTAVNIARQVYQIDTTEMLLQGFSLGGRAALKYGLDSPSHFKGLLLNTPAIQGVKNALNVYPAFLFNYANASQIPLFITHGETDYLYTAPIDTCVEKLILNNGLVRMYRYPGLGHVIPSYNLMSQVSTFFDTPASPGFDAELFRIQIPGQTCQTSINPQCLLRNTGSNTLNAAQLEYTYNGIPQTTTWTGSLSPFQHAWVNLPTLSSVSGKQMLDVKILQVNGYADTFLMNNERTDSVLYYLGGMAIPQSEGFEAGKFPPDGWRAERYGDEWTYFDLDDQVKKSGLYSVYAFNTIFLFDNQGRRAEMVSPPIQLNSTATPTVSFDYSFNFTRYTPPYFTTQTDFTDTLEILVSTDCGQTFQSVFKKWGGQLATFASPIMNPLNVQAVFVNPKDSNWRKEIIDLSPFTSATEAMVKWRYISGLGGNINIDNILFNNVPLSNEEASIQAPLTIYPNPAKSFVQISGLSTGSDEHRVMLYSMTGSKHVDQVFQANAGTYQLALPQLSPGVYTLLIDGEKRSLLIE